MMLQLRSSGNLCIDSPDEGRTIYQVSLVEEPGVVKALLFLSLRCDLQLDVLVQLSPLAEALQASARTLW